MGDWVGQMKQSTSFDLDLIRLVIEAMGEGGKVTINWTEGGHGREEGGQEYRSLRVVHRPLLQHPVSQIYGATTTFHFIQGETVLHRRPIFSYQERPKVQLASHKTTNAANYSTSSTW
jgi:hypothetical protein